MRGYKDLWIAWESPELADLPYSRKVLDLEAFLAEIVIRVEKDLITDLELQI